MVYLIGRQLSINAEYFYLLSITLIDSLPLRQRIPLGLAGHLGLGDCMPSIGPGPRLGLYPIFLKNPV